MTRSRKTNEDAMTRYRLSLAAASAALLLATSSIASQALEVKAGVGGINANVTVGEGSVANAKASVGNTANAKATVGGGGGNVASTKATVGNNNVTANIGTGNGPLVDSSTSGNPLGGGLTSGTSVNLGGLFGGGGGGGNSNVPGGGGGIFDGGGGGGTGGGGNGGSGGNNRGLVPGTVQAAISDMSDGEVATMKRRCDSILMMPTGYDQGIIDLCRVLRRL
jgi:hypothetical protein